MAKSWLNFLFVLFTALSLSSCSFRRIAIERADWVLLMQMDSCFDLSWKQEGELKPQIKQYLDLLRKNTVPKAVAWLRSAADEIIKPYDEKMFRHYWDAAWSLRSELLLAGVPFAATNLKRLTDEQLRDCQQELVDKDKKFYKLLDKEEADFQKGYFKQAIKSNFDMMKNLFGDLSEDQMKLLTTLNATTKTRLTEQLTRKRKYQNAFFAAVKNQELEELLQSMPLWIQDSRTMLNPNIQAEPGATWRASFMIKASQFMPTLSDKQKEHFRQELLSLAQDLEKI